MDTSRTNLFKTKMDVELGTNYLPKPIARQPKLFSPGMLQLISKGERTFTRADEHIGSSPYLDCVRNMTLNMEALSAAIIDGAEIDLMRLLLHDIKKDPNADLSDVRVSSSTSARAIQYRDYLENHNSCSDMGDFSFSKESITRIYEELNYPQGYEFNGKMRGESQDGRDDSRQGMPNFRIVPADMVDEYMEDLCKFCNTVYYTPQIQAGLAHFQMQYIRPFESHVDALGRHISYIVYAKRDFSRNIIVAASIESLRRIDDPLDSLKANSTGSVKQSPLELWIYHGAHMLIRQADMIFDMESTFIGIEKDWRGKVPKVRRDDICDILLHDLLAHPIINAKYVAERCGKTLPAANDALKKLVEAQILSPIDNRKRNRYFYAVDVLDYYRSLMDSIIPRGWLPGQELFNL